MRHIPLNIKLVLAFLIVGLGPFMFIGQLSLLTARASLEQQVLRQLDAIEEIKKNQIERYFDDRYVDIGLLAQNAIVKNALSTYAMAFHEEGKRVDGGWWNDTDSQYGPWFEEYIRTKGYYDLFLIDAEGYVVYTVARESDLGENVVEGNLKDSGLGECYEKSENTTSFIDFAPYAPSNDAPACFLGTPIIAGERVLGVLALQISNDSINEIMQERTGLGQTGETYLIGPDNLMRSDSYRDPVNHSVAASFANPRNGSIDTAASRAALAGTSGEEIIIDYNGNSVLSAYSPVRISDVTWAILAEIDEAEAFQPIEALEAEVLRIGIIGAILIAVFALFVAWNITHSFKQLFRGLKSFSGGELKTTARKFTGIIDSLNSSSDQVAATSEQVSSTSQQIAEGAGEQASSFEEISSSLEEMTAMTAQNAQNASECNNAMHEAGKSFERIETYLAKLVASVNDIDRNSQDTQKIIKTIDEIAFQTNLLALNAAVEAARAGEAGLGFAVVAEEVRNLSQRAAEAAKNTQELIEKTVSSVSNGTGLMSEVQGAINENMSIGGRVATLVAEIAAASNEQAQGINQINTAISQLDTVTQSNAANAEESASASEELTSQASELHEMVETLIRIVKGTSQPIRKTRTEPHASRAAENDKHTVIRAQRPKTLIPNKVTVGAMNRTPADLIPLDDEFEGF